MLAAVANTSAGLHDDLRKTDKSADLLANPRLFRPPSPPLTDDKEKDGGQTRAACVQDYSPCSCSVQLDNQFSVLCQDISVETVRDVFQRVNDPEIFQLELFQLGGDTNTFFLPPDILGNTTVTSYILIDCIGFSGNSNPNLVIDSSAFRLSQNSLAKLTIYNCDFSLQKDFNFLNGFNKLEELNIYNTINMTAFQYLPPLPSLQKLSVTYCPDLNQIPFPDLNPAKLNNLDLRGNKISDQTADEIVANLVASNSAESLEFLSLMDNCLTRIPSQVGSTFPQIKSFNLVGNSISHIQSSSLNFASPYLEDLFLNSIGLNTIESDAFGGKLTD